MRFANCTAQSIHLDLPDNTTPQEEIENTGKMVMYLWKHWPMSVFIHRAGAGGLDFTDLDIQEALGA